MASALIAGLNDEDIEYVDVALTEADDSYDSTYTVVAVTATRVLCPPSSRI